MRKKQENKFTMLKAVEALLDENQNIVSSIAELQQHHNLLKALTQQITLKEEQKRTVLGGKTLRKLSEKNDSIKKAMAISGALYAYARKTHNIELSEIADVFRTDLSRIRDTELLGVLKTLRELASENLASLEPFGVTNEKLAAFTEKIRLYENAIGQKETGSTTRSGAVKTLKAMFQEADALLLSIDRLVNGVHEEHPVFHQDYYITRAIKNLGLRHRSEEPPGNLPGIPQANQPVIPENTGGSS